MPTKVIMPQMGESVVEGTVGQWLKREGDPVSEYEPIVEVETDKVTSEVTASTSGTLLKIYVGEGLTVPTGTVLALIGQPDEAVPDVVEAEAVVAFGHAAPEATISPPEAPPAPEARPAARSHVTPVVARMAAQHAIDVSRIQGTGHGGRVTKRDLLAYLERSSAAEQPTPELPPWEQPGSGELFKIPTEAPAPTPPPDHAHKAPPAPGAPGDLIPHSPMRRRIAEHMVRSKLHTAPHVTTVFEADMGAVVAHRAAHKDDFARRGTNLTFTAYFVAVTAQALRRHPAVNSEWREDGLLLKPEVNIGMAVALDEGLIVPVIRRADELSLAGIARQANDLAARARAGKLSPDDVQGGTFTLTNHGVSGSLFATPIINQPQTGILGVGAIKKRVVVLEDQGDALAVRPMVYLSFTFDHRTLDGAAADWFVAEIVRLLEGWSLE